MTMKRTTFGFVSNSHFVFSAGNQARSIGGEERFSSDSRIGLFERITRLDGGESYD